MSTFAHLNMQVFFSRPTTRKSEYMRSSKWHKSYRRTFFLFVSCRAYRTNRSKVDGLQQTTFDSDIATFKMNLFRTFCPTKEIAFSIAVPTVRRQVEMYNRKNKLFLLIVVVLPHFFWLQSGIFFQCILWLRGVEWHTSRWMLIRTNQINGEF